KGEFELLESLPTRKERKALFYRFWTLKESFMKATREGMALSTKSFEIDFKEYEHCYRYPYLKVQPKEWSDKFYYREFKPENVAISICANEDLSNRNCKFTYVEL
ncbi:MAG: 4'-phosphopantetheinyl transferase superfamily protein, partial [Lachnospiraceae bacterium]|nr:4'-phosphopantetheinyl transferase superfamily protein [Lachnospiraceae bacterium]